MGTENSSNEYQEARQHLSLSATAWAVLQDDRQDFGGGRSWAGILNYVFAVYRDKADASISVAVERRREQLEEQLGGVVSPAARDAVLDRLMEVYAGELAEKAMSDGAVAQQKEVFKFRLDRDNYAFREQWLDSPDAARYYGNRFSRYLRAVLEEYAAKTVYQREAIYFDPQMRLIRAAAVNGELLRIRLKKGSSFEVRPYGVLGDRQETYHYLVGLSRPDGTREPEKEYNFRLSNIVKLEVSFRRSGRLTEKERTDIESSIRGEGDDPYPPDGEGAAGLWASAASTPRNGEKDGGGRRPVPLGVYVQLHAISGTGVFPQVLRRSEGGRAPEPAGHLCPGIPERPAGLRRGAVTAGRTSGSGMKHPRKKRKKRCSRQGIGNTALHGGFLLLSTFPRCGAEHFLA